MLFLAFTIGSEYRLCKRFVVNLLHPILPESYSKSFGNYKVFTLVYAMFHSSIGKQALWLLSMDNSINNKQATSLNFS